MLTCGIIGSMQKGDKMSGKNELPAVDVVSVIRCKDCKYWQDNNGGYPNTECRWGHDETPDADDFCSYAELK